MVVWGARLKGGLEWEVWIAHGSEVCGGSPLMFLPERRRAALRSPQRT